MKEVYLLQVNFIKLGWPQVWFSWSLRSIISDFYFLRLILAIGRRRKLQKNWLSVTIAKIDWYLNCSLKISGVLDACIGRSFLCWLGVRFC